MPAQSSTDFLIHTLRLGKKQYLFRQNKVRRELDRRGTIW
jgi:hypothetical protein